MPRTRENREPGDGNQVTDETIPLPVGSVTGMDIKGHVVHVKGGIQLSGWFVWSGTRDSEGRPWRLVFSSGDRARGALNNYYGNPESPDFADFQNRVYHHGHGNLEPEAKMIRRVVGCFGKAVGLVILASLPPLGQSAARVEFEVAAVKPNLSDSGGGQLDYSGVTFRAENVNLKQLISYAYAIPQIQISGQGWLELLGYDINAKSSPGAPASEVRLMLQALLEDRFHLKIHHETREVAVSILTVARGGFKIKPEDPAHPQPFPPLPAGGWKLMQTSGSLPEIAARLSVFVHRPVLDRTGIRGKYRVRIYFNNSPDSEGPDMYAALREQLGLRLEQGRAPVEMLVVDSADKVPVSN